MNADRWAIIDDNGIIDDGPEESVRDQFERYVSGGDTLDHRAGDLLLVRIVVVHK